MSVPHLGQSICHLVDRVHLLKSENIEAREGGTRRTRPSLSSSFPSLSSGEGGYHYESIRPAQPSAAADYSDSDAVALFSSSSYSSYIVIAFDLSPLPPS